MVKPSAILLFAAGLGTRMGNLVADKPKPLIRVAGHTLLDHAMRIVEDANVKTCVVNTHYKGQMIEDHLAPKNVLFSDESDMLRETGGGLRHALPLLQSNPVFTLNTDAVWEGPNPISFLLERWDAKMDALLLNVPSTRAVGHIGSGDFDRQPNGQIIRGRSQIYTGLQIVRTDRLAEIGAKAFSMNLLWDMFDEDGRLYGATYPGQWCDVGRPESIPLAEKMVAYQADV